MKRQRSTLSAFVLALVVAASQAVAADKPHNVVPPNGYVPNEETAIRIALAVWEPIYGASQIAEQKPYRARLERGVWIVEGTSHAEMGGVAIAEIAKADGRVLRVSHGR